MRLLSIVGARPNFVKLAPVAHESRNRGIEHLILHTGQHYDFEMSQTFFEGLAIPSPERHLELNEISPLPRLSRMILEIEAFVCETKPDRMIVYGDVDSTLAGALVAGRLRIPLAHVESGLRSFNMEMPEEMNRRLTDHLADWLFAPTENALTNLRHEGIKDSKIHHVGSTVIDALIHSLDRIKEKTADVLEALSIKDDEPYTVMTLHRAGLVDSIEKMRLLAPKIERLAQKAPILFPVHPRTRKTIESTGLFKETSKLRMIAPLSYLEFLALVNAARLVISDSGGIQTETSFLGIPCLTLRDQTEWVETLKNGTNALLGEAGNNLEEAFENALNAPRRPLRLPFDDGKCSERILDALLA